MWLPCVCFSNNFPLYLKESLDTLATTYKSPHIFYLVLRLNLFPSWFHLVPLPWLTQPVLTPSLFCLYPPPMVSLPHLQPRGQHESHSLDLSAATTSSRQLSFNSRYLSPLPVLGNKYLKFFFCGNCSEREVYTSWPSCSTGIPLHSTRGEVVSYFSLTHHRIQDPTLDLIHSSHSIKTW